MLYRTFTRIWGAYGRIANQAYIELRLPVDPKVAADSTGITDQNLDYTLALTRYNTPTSSRNSYYLRSSAPKQTSPNTASRNLRPPASTSRFRCKITPTMNSQAIRSSYRATLRELKKGVRRLFASTGSEIRGSHPFLFEYSARKTSAVLQ